MTSNTFCALPWMHLATSPSGSFRVCCNSVPPNNLLQTNGKKHKIHNSTAEEAWNSETNRDIRLQMLAGERPNTCTKCFREEAQGMRSPRMIANKNYQKYVPNPIEITDADGSTPINVIYLDLRLGNKCNIKCVMCSPFSSNQWLKEWNDVNPVKLTEDEHNHLTNNMSWPDNHSWLTTIEPHLSTITKIYFTGGEPTLADAHLDLLQLCINRGYAQNMTIKYNTNLTNVPVRAIQYWDKFDKVLFNVSIDGYDKINDYVRYPSVWKVIDKNLHTLNDMAANGKIMIGVHACIQAHNILSITPLMDYLVQFKNITSFPYLNVLDHPDHLNIRVLPDKLKQIAADRLLNWKASHSADEYTDCPDSPDQSKIWFDRIDQVVNYMQSESWYDKHFNAFVKFTQGIEKHRGNSIAALIPEWAEFIDNEKIRE